jgi:serine/threonine protein kinase
MIGKTISHYKIIEKLGEGGMGVVYKAEDTKLDRIVALKFLTPQAIGSDEDKDRFVQEAKAAAALNHPNICTIYEIDEVDGRSFIAMECVEGQSLKERIGKGLLSLDEALDIVLQIADGLHEAHEKGIVHRDIKPANIMLTGKSQAKIMDFGLAKSPGRAKLTKTHTTIGTVAYMSPEQSRAEKVDHRTDIWSLGVVLYEMLTGRQPFAGDYEQAIVYSILNNSPEPVTALRSGLPMDLERIVNKALTKNADARYQHIDDMQVDIKSTRAESQTGDAQVIEKKPVMKLRIGALLSALVIVILLLTVLEYLWVRDDEKGLQIARTTPLTSAPGLETNPTWSPDGTRIAYESNESGNWDVWVHQLQAGRKVNLTADYDGYDGKPVWSPKGDRIAFISDRDEGGVFVMPSIGGIPRRVLQTKLSPFGPYFNLASPIEWSPDGTKLLCISLDGGMSTFPAEGGMPSALDLPGSKMFLDVAWSSTGDRIAATDITGTGTSVSTIYTMKPDGSYLQALTDGNYMEHYPVWSSEGDKLFFVSDRMGSRDVWFFSIDVNGGAAGPAKQLTSGVGVGTIALSADGKKLVYSKFIERSDIWAIPIGSDSMLTMDDAVRITSENDLIEFHSISPDGEWIVFDSNRSGNQDIWIMRKDGSGLRQITTHEAHDWFPQWSPDGERIAFYSIRSGNRDIYTIPVLGGVITQLTTSPELDWTPVWSPDGRELAYSSGYYPDNTNLWIVPSDGGEPRQLTFAESPDAFPVWAPNGRTIAFARGFVTYVELYLLAAEGGEPVKLTDNQWAFLAPQFWSKDGGTIYTVGMREGHIGDALWAISTTSGEARSLVDFKGSLSEPYYALSMDGERLYFTMWERLGDLWMAELSVEE